MFEPFFTTKPVGLGSGMRLAAAYGTIGSDGGSIQFDATMGQGSTFRMLIPYATQESREGAMPGGHGSALAEQKLNQHVLVVDDEALVRDALLALIDAFGYRVEGCADGPTAIEKLKSDPAIGLVILDLVLPGMGGPAIFRAMRSLRPDLRLLISSGYADSEECRQLVAEGAAGTLAKPFRAEDLKRTLCALLGEPVAP